MKSDQTVNTTPSNSKLADCKRDAHIVNFMLHCLDLQCLKTFRKHRRSGPVCPPQRPRAEAMFAKYLIFSRL